MNETCFQPWWNSSQDQSLVIKYTTTWPCSFTGSYLYRSHVMKPGTHVSYRRIFERLCDTRTWGFCDMRTNVWLWGHVTYPDGKFAWVPPYFIAHRICSDRWYACRLLAMQSFLATSCCLQAADICSRSAGSSAQIVGMGGLSTPSVFLSHKQ